MSATATKWLFSRDLRVGYARPQTSRPDRGAAIWTIAGARYAAHVARFAWRRSAVAGICVSLAVACTLLNPLDAYGPPVPKIDAAIDAAEDAGVDSACRRATWPARPSAEDTASVDEIVFAAESIDVAAPDGGTAPIGYDLDGVCTCPEPSSCLRPLGAKPVCDEPDSGGIDLGGTEFLEQALSVAGGSVRTTAQINRGDRGLLFRLKNYNGTADDKRVEFAIFLSGGNEGAQSGTPMIPKRDGTDAWTVDPKSLFGGVGPPYRPLYVDPDAYVSEGTLVASIKFPLSLSTVVMRLEAATLTAKVTRVGTGYRLDEGHVVGRWATRDLLTALDTIADPTGAPGTGLCGDSGLYQQLKENICGAVDITADPLLDNKGAFCNALAVRVLFTAGPAKLGALFGLAAGLHRCGDQWTDECVP
jgi:hypothetical protein